MVIMVLKPQRERFDHGSFELCYDGKWNLEATGSRGLGELKTQKILSQNSKSQPPTFPIVQIYVARPEEEVVGRIVG